MFSLRPASVPPQAFADLLSGGEQFDASMTETYKLLGVDPASVNTLDSYLKVGPGAGSSSTWRGVWPTVCASACGLDWDALVLGMDRRCRGTTRTLRGVVKGCETELLNSLCLPE